MRCHLIGKIPDARIKIMVPHDTGVVTHLRHRPDLRLPFEHIEIGRSLEDIPGIQQEDMLLFAPDPAYEGSTGCHSAATGIGAGICRKRIQPAMDIIGVQDGQSPGLLFSQAGRGGRPAQHQGGSRQTRLP